MTGAAVLHVVVTGTPAPQGSKRHVGNGVMVESSAKVKPWRQDVAAAAAESVVEDGWVPFDGAVTVEIIFLLRRPSSAPKRVRYPFRKPDLDKLIRSTLDALVTAGALVDDARVTDLNIKKRFAAANQATGAFIVISETV